MKVLSHADPEAKSILEKVKNKVTVDHLDSPYWVFVQNSDPIGIMRVAEEPGPLLASPGTAYAHIVWIDTQQPDENIKSFIAQALKIGSQENIKYATTIFPFSKEKVITQFQNAGFSELNDSYTMTKPLDASLRLPEILQFEQVKRVEMRQFGESVKRFFQDSPDKYVAEALEHVLELPAQFLDQVYDREKFYFAVREGQIVGVLNFNATSGWVSNMGVDPLKRGRGFGRAILLFALEQLRRSGCKQATLRVHTQNKPAIHLYKSVGFVEKERHVALIWRR
jgi:ribosomal protein S18 acetylase RimI-like enzyme